MPARMDEVCASIFYCFRKWLCLSRKPNGFGEALGANAGSAGLGPLRKDGERGELRGNAVIYTESNPGGMMCRRIELLHSFP